MQRQQPGNWSDSNGEENVVPANQQTYNKQQVYLEFSEFNPAQIKRIEDTFDQCVYTAVRHVCSKRADTLQGNNKIDTFPGEGWIRKSRSRLLTTTTATNFIVLNYTKNSGLNTENFRLLLLYRSPPSRKAIWFFSHLLLFGSCPRTLRKQKIRFTISRL